MLERNHFPETASPQASDVKAIDLDRIFSLLRRQARVLILCVAIGLGLAGFYLTLAPRSYVSAGQILIDKKLEQVVSDNVTSVSAVELEAQVLNQIEILRSSRLAIAVAQAENLMTDQEFLNPPKSFSARVKSLAIGFLPFLGNDDAPAATLEATVEEVAGKLRSNVQVERMGRSSIIRIGYEAATPELAQRIASAYAGAFVQDQLNADLDATRAAGDWLQQRLTEIGESQRQASLAIEQFRQTSGLSVGQDRTLSNQRIESLSNQLATAQAETARIRALSGQVQTVIAAGPEGAANQVSLLADAGADQRDIASLRAQYATLTSRMAEITTSFGADHPQVAALSAERAVLNNQIYAQLQGLSEHYTTQLAIAEQQERGLRQDIDNEGRAFGEVSQAQVELTELQQRSAALGILYNTFLARYEESIQQQSFPIPAARIITEPLMPDQPASPRTMVIIAAAVIFGLFMGLVLGAFNELRERAFRTGSQIRKELDLRFLGYVPQLSLGSGLRDKQQKSNAVHAFLRNQIVGRGGRAASTPLLETLKSARLAIRTAGPDGGGAVIGIVSVLPGEGKTTFAVSLAEMLAASGSKVLLVDGDLRQPAASRLVGKEAEHGLMDIGEGRDWRSIAQTDPETGLVMVLANSAGPGVSANDFLSSGAMQGFLAESRRAFDYVVVDLPPLGPVVDAMSVLPWTDGFVLVAEWGRTPRRLVRSLLEREPQLANDVLGVVLNKVDFSRLSRYSDAGGVERFTGAYQRYYEVESAVETAPR